MLVAAMNPTGYGYVLGTNASEALEWSRGIIELHAGFEF